MDKKSYHHGDLKQQMIHNGLLLLNKDGFEGFSLRKVAAMCGVSHNAPYKHFKDKEALIEEIVGEVWKAFYIALKEVTEIYTADAAEQILEMGKAYVKFMVENPEYMKLMFLSETSYPVAVEKVKQYGENAGSFGVFKCSAERYFKSIELDEALYVQRTMMLWSMVHGISILVIKKSISYEGDYLELVELMIRDGLGLGKK